MGTVQFSRLASSSGQFIGMATLDNPKALNALSLDMIQALETQLTLWQADPQLLAVVLAGSGDKAFCAGGDVRALRAELLPPKPCPHPATTRYFAEEYTLDYHIHRYQKPLIAWGHGMVMGGGMGLFCGASHRILGPNSRLAMPEISIGLYPDVGGSWFLSRLPGKLGLFLALTGAALNARDALLANLGDYYLPHDSLPRLLDTLSDHAWPSDPSQHKAHVSALLSQLEQPCNLESELWRHFDLIRTLMNQPSLASLHQALQAAEFDEPWLAQARLNFLKGSPLSAAISWAIHQRAPFLSLLEVFQLELGLSVKLASQGDFIEGVRALLVDRDRQPGWSQHWDELDPQWVEQFFVSPWPADQHPLQHLTPIA